MKWAWIGGEGSEDCELGLQGWGGMCGRHPLKGRGGAGRCWSLGAVPGGRGPWKAGGRDGGWKGLPPACSPAPWVPVHVRCAVTVMPDNLCDLQGRMDVMTNSRFPDC